MNFCYENEKKEKSCALIGSLLCCGFVTLSYLFQVADYNVVAAQQGIVYIDEVDKITKKVTFGRINNFVHLEALI